MTRKQTLLKALILLSTAYAMAMVFHWTIGFTYFTQLSNLFAAGVALAQLLARGRGPAWLKPLKFSATVSITVTFLVYLTVLAPLTPGGLLAAYGADHCASLCLHVITPLLTLADFFLNDAGFPWRRRHLLWAAAPPLGYLAFILALGRFGVRWGRGSMAAPYMFLNYEGPAGWFGFAPEAAGLTAPGIGAAYCMALLLLGILALGALLLALARRFGSGN